MPLENTDVTTSLDLVAVFKLNPNGTLREPPIEKRKWNEPFKGRDPSLGLRGQMRWPIENDRFIEKFPISRKPTRAAQDWLQFGNIRAELFDSPLANLIRGSLRNEKSALPVMLAVDHDEHSARFDVPQGLTGIAGTPADPHPQDIHGSA
jgi:hypothetical protein